MAIKAMLTTTTAAQAQKVKDSGVPVIWTYPGCTLVRGEAEQLAALRREGVEVGEIEEQPVRTGRATFFMESAVAAEAVTPIPVRNNRKNYYLVQLAGPPAADWIEQLTTHGALTHDSLAHDTLLVGALPSSLAAIRALPWVQAVTPYRPAMKISPQFAPFRALELKAAELESVAPAEVPEQIQQIEVSMFPGESSEEVAAMIREAGGTILNQSALSVAARVPEKALASLAEHGGVQAVLPHEFPVFSNDRSAPVMGVPGDHSLQGSVLRGEGQIVAIADSGIDTGDPLTLHTDFNGRVLDIVSLPVNPAIQQLATGPAGFNDGAADLTSGHGTHVSGSVLGDGSVARASGAPVVPMGIAPGAKLFFQAVEQRVDWKPNVQPPPPASGLYGLPDNLETLFGQAYLAGARIHTNSWGGPARDRNGANIAGQYTAHGSQVDKFTFEHADMLILFAAGNSGLDEDGDGMVDPDSIGSPSEAKNCLTVGASEGDRPSGSTPPPGLDADWNRLQKFQTIEGAGHVSDQPEGMACFSSRGPAGDGRIKPDVVAPGTNILSTKSSVAAGSLWGDVKPDTSPMRNKYCWSGGTSMATPLVAGTAALVREHLVKQRGHVKAGEKPSGALLKAILVNGARSIAGNFAGEVPPVPNSVCGFGLVDLTAALDSLQFDDEADHAVGTGQTRLYELAARDRAKAMNVTLVWTDAPATVGQGGLTNRLYLQVVTPGGEILDGDVSRFPNALNNVQRVIVDLPEDGVYQVRVRGVSIARHSPVVALPNPPLQNFALAASNAFSLRFVS